MRHAVIFKEMFGLLKHWSFVLIVPAIVGLITKEYYIMAEFIMLFGLVFVLSAMLQRAIVTDELARVREGLISIALSWLCITLIGSSIYTLNLDISFLDGFFESMSSWTTTGLSVLQPEGLPMTILFWRSFGQWVGGLGVVILAAGNLFKSSNALFIAEGRNDRIKPNIINSFQIMSSIYFLYTLIGLVALWIFGMSFFEAMNHSMTAIATGGMSTKNASIAAFPALGIQITLIVMMILGNISFYHHHHLLQGNFKRFFKSMQNATLAILIIVPTLFLLMQTNFLSAVFHVVSAIGTGFNTADISQWTPGGKLVLVMLMIIGGVAGSTAGGIKIHRLDLVIKTLSDRLKKLRRPHRLFSNKLDGQSYTNKDIVRVFTFITVYLIILLIGTITISLQGHSIGDALLETASAQGNVGLSSGIEYGSVEKVTLIFVMWAGRLEIWAILVTLINFLQRGLRL